MHVRLVLLWRNKGSEASTVVLKPMVVYRRNAMIRHHLLSRIPTILPSRHLFCDVLHFKMHPKNSKGINQQHDCMLSPWQYHFKVRTFVRICVCLSSRSNIDLIVYFYTTGFSVYLRRIISCLTVSANCCKTSFFVAFYIEYQFSHSFFYYLLLLSFYTCCLAIIDPSSFSAFSDCLFSVPC
jgi:hypothetical protein